MIEVITSKSQWSSLINDIGVYDFYSTYDYHALSSTDEEQNILIKYTEEDIIIGLPLVIRQIRNTSFYDATSVYGYAGPISKNIPENFNNQLFIQELYAFFVENQIVSVFSRLNPYLPRQFDILKGIGEIHDKGNIVMIDLSENVIAQKQNYHRRTKTYINKARKFCDIKRAESNEDIDAFINLYYENMRRVGAKKSYFFSRNYFYKFTHIDNCEVEISLASLRDTKEVISGAMFVKTKGIIQYHLSGTNEAYLEVPALKLLIDDMRIRGAKENYKVFNLGGGLNSKDDSLLRFKRSFSKKSKKFSVWQYVVNEEIYNELKDSVKTPERDYFPEYRYPE